MENTVRCLKILSALAEDCSSDMLERCSVATVMFISLMCKPLVLIICALVYDKYIATCTKG